MQFSLKGPHILLGHQICPVCHLWGFSLAGADGQACQAAYLVRQNCQQTHPQVTLSVNPWGTEFIFKKHKNTDAFQTFHNTEMER